VLWISDDAAALSTKRLGLLKAMSPQLRKGAVLWNKDDLGMSQRYDASAQAAQELGVLPLGVREPDDFNEASASMDRGSPDAILMVTDSVTLINRKRVFDYAAQHRLPAIYEQDFMDRDGGLMSYGAEAQESFDRARRCANRPHFSRHGAPDLPFEMPTRYRRRHHHRLSAADSAIEVLCTSTPWLPPAPPTSPSPPTAPSFAPNQNSQKRNHRRRPQAAAPPSRLKRLALIASRVRKRDQSVNSVNSKFDWRDRLVVHAYRLGHLARLPSPSIK
jgi:hypothetical protein